MHRLMQHYLVNAPLAEIRADYGWIPIRLFTSGLYKFAPFIFDNPLKWNIYLVWVFSLHSSGLQAGKIDFHPHHSCFGE